MDAKKRRSQILAILKKSQMPVSASSLAEQLSVSRQIIDVYKRQVLAPPDGSRQNRRIISSHDLSYPIVWLSLASLPRSMGSTSLSL